MISIKTKYTLIFIKEFIREYWLWPSLAIVACIFLYIGFSRDDNKIYWEVYDEITIHDKEYLIGIGPSHEIKIFRKSKVEINNDNIITIYEIGVLKGIIIFFSSSVLLFSIICIFSDPSGDRSLNSVRNRAGSKLIKSIKEGDMYYYTIGNRLIHESTYFKLPSDIKFLDSYSNLNNYPEYESLIDKRNKKLKKNKINIK